MSFFRQQSQAQNLTNPQLRGMHPAMPRPQMPPPRPPQASQPPQKPQMMPNDPSVRFEPYNPNGDGAQNPQNMPLRAENSNLVDFIQGEINSLAFYENLGKAVDNNTKERLGVFLGNKRQNVEHLRGFYKATTGGEFAAKEVKIEEVPHFKAGISFAISQEAQLLRQLSQILANLKNEAHQKMLSPILYAKVADIACLISI